MSAPSYRIVRMFDNGEFRVIRSGVTKAEAERHCSDPETASESARGSFARHFTRRYGAWVDGFQKEA